MVCHASAWDVELADDQRVKMCIRPTLDDLVTMHHELGHNYYNHYHTDLPMLLQGGAHDGFHEAIGDAIALSITPGYLHQLGLVESIEETPEAVLNKQMLDALQKVSFLPFGRMIDQWRWDVFSGKVDPDDWNAHWWKLRAQYQGIGAPGERPVDAFDPGAKFHIPGNTPYLRYFLASILQFQMHEAMCDAAGTSPLHSCAAASRPGRRWRPSCTRREQALAGRARSHHRNREMDAGPMLEYFAPLRGTCSSRTADRSAAGRFPSRHRRSRTSAGRRRATRRAAGPMCCYPRLTGREHSRTCIVRGLRAIPTARPEPDRCFACVRGRGLRSVPASSIPSGRSGCWIAGLDCSPDEGISLDWHLTWCPREPRPQIDSSLRPRSPSPARRSPQGQGGRGADETFEEATEGMLIAPLYEVLQREADLRKAIAVRTGIPELAFQGRIVLTIDEATSFDLIQRVMYTAGQAQYGEFQLVGLNHWEQDLRGFTTALPAFGMPEVPHPDARPPLHLALTVDMRGIHVETNDPEFASELADRAPTFPCASDEPCNDLSGHDWQGLSTLLARMKEQHPEESTIHVIGGDPQVSWATLLRAMDCARNAPYLPLDASQESWTGWTSTRKELFADPIISGGGR